MVQFVIAGRCRPLRGAALEAAPRLCHHGALSTSNANSINDTVWHAGSMTRARRELHNAHKGGAIWFTGVSAPYEAPLAPELSLDSGRQDLDAAVALVLALPAVRAFSSLPA